MVNTELVSTELSVSNWFETILSKFVTDNYMSSFNTPVVKPGCCAGIGSPVQFKVIDVNKVVVRGDGLGLVPVNRPAAFIITAPDAQLSDIDVAITSAFKRLFCTLSLV